MCATTHRRRRKAMATTRCGSIASSDERLRHTSISPAPVGRVGAGSAADIVASRVRVPRAPNAARSEVSRGRDTRPAPTAATPVPWRVPTRRRSRADPRAERGVVAAGGVDIKLPGRRYFARAEPCLSRRTRVSAGRARRSARASPRAKALTPSRARSPRDRTGSGVGRPFRFAPVRRAMSRRRSGPT